MTESLSAAPDPLRRLTIGLATANVSVGVSAPLWSAVLDAAQRHDVNLICFPGGEVRTTGRPANAVYELIDPDVLDGLICWTSALELPAEPGRTSRLTERFARLPLVSLNQSIGSAHPLVIDSYTGMCAVVDHLIGTHQRSRIAFIPGSTTNAVSAERLRAFSDTLARHRIPLDRRLVSTPAEIRAGASAMQVLLDTRGLHPGRDFDAVVASSDLLAAQALQLLSDRQVGVPEEVAVVGCNGLPEARLTDPPLTSVSLPFAELGELAVETLLQRLSGYPVPDRPRVRPRLVIRRSCGCLGAGAADPDGPEVPARLDRLSSLTREQLVTSLGHAMSSAADLAALDQVLDRRLRAFHVRQWGLCLEPGGSLAAMSALPVGRRYSMVAEPLYVRDQLLGFALFEVGPRDGAVYRAVADQISHAVLRIRLIQDAVAARESAERASRAKSALLAGLSETLREPVVELLREHSRVDRAVSTLDAPPKDLVTGLARIRASAERQLRVIGDMLDLARIDLHAVDLTSVLLDAGELLSDVFGLSSPVALPLIQADPRRLRQVLTALAVTADRLTARTIVQAEVQPPDLRIRLRLACGLPLSAATVGAELPLPIAQRLIALHGGSLRFQATPDGGIFRIALPLPTPAGGRGTRTRRGELLSVGEVPAAAELAARLGVTVTRAGSEGNAIPRDLAGVALDFAGLRAEDWAAARRLLDHPALSNTSFLVYGRPDAASHRLTDLLAAVRPAGATGPIVIAGMPAESLGLYQRSVRRLLPEHPVLTVPDGTTALSVLEPDVPSLLILAYALPDMSAVDLLDRLAAAAAPARIPALVLSAVVAPELLEVDRHPGALLVRDGILTESETAELLDRLRTDDSGPTTLNRIRVRQAVAYLHQRFHHPITRLQLADATGMSADYLSRLFHRELGLSPWIYLNRLRIEEAKQRLRRSDDSIQLIARRVGFRDPAYFSRTFRKLTGRSPKAYRESSLVT